MPALSEGFLNYFINALADGSFWKDFLELTAEDEEQLSVWADEGGSLPDVAKQQKTGYAIRQEREMADRNTDVRTDSQSDGYASDRQTDWGGYGNTTNDRVNAEHIELEETTGWISPEFQEDIERVQKMHEEKATKGLRVSTENVDRYLDYEKDAPEKYDPTCGLSQVAHTLTLTFRDFTPANLAEAANLYGVPGDAKYKFWSDKYTQSVDIEWTETL